MKTTLKKLRYKNACKRRYAWLARSLDGVEPSEDSGCEYIACNYDDDKPITLQQIFDMNGFDDSLWALASGSFGDEAKRRCVSLLCDYSERVLPIYEKRHPGDNRVRNCIETTRKWTRGDATIEDVEKASHAADTARAAGYSAAYAAYAAGYSAAYAAYADHAAAYAAHAARAAAYAARAADAAGYSAERKKQIKMFVDAFGLNKEEDDK